MKGKYPPKNYSTRDHMELISDFSIAVSSDQFNNPLIVHHYKGGAYDTVTGEYSGGVLLYREFHRWTEDGEGWISSFTQ